MLYYLWNISCNSTADEVLRALSWWTFNTGSGLMCGLFFYTDQEHYNPEREHNPEYDHEAFLGEEQAHEFDRLSPEESKRRLG